MLWLDERDGAGFVDCRNCCGVLASVHGKDDSDRQEQRHGASGHPSYNKDNWNRSDQHLVVGGGCVVSNRSTLPSRGPLQLNLLHSTSVLGVDVTVNNTSDHACTSDW